MNIYNSFLDAEDALCRKIVLNPDFVTDSTYEVIGTGFILEKPWLNRNNRSNYQYAEEFFAWIMTGEKQLSENLLRINPWVQRFVDNTGLPENFSSSYGWKIKDQLQTIITELRNHSDSRRAYINILQPADQVVLGVKSTHEFPCTIGLQFFRRDDKLNLIVNMRSNNVYAVMPYDVFIFTNLLAEIAERLTLSIGKYYHQINSAHIFKGDVRRIREQLFLKP